MLTAITFRSLSARLLRDDPGAIVQAHLAYFAAGAQVATTASHQASIDGFVRAGISPVEAQHLIKAQRMPRSAGTRQFRR